MVPGLLALQLPKKSIPVYSTIKGMETPIKGLNLLSASPDMHACASVELPGVENITLSQNHLEQLPPASRCPRLDLPGKLLSTLPTLVRHIPLSNEKWIFKDRAPLQVALDL